MEQAGSTPTPEIIEPGREPVLVPIDVLLDMHGNPLYPGEFIAPGERENVVRHIVQPNMQLPPETKGLHPQTQASDPRFRGIYDTSNL